MSGSSRLLAGSAVVAVSAALSSAEGPHRLELAVSHRINDLPDWLHPPVWCVMQLGALGAGPALGAIAWRSGNRELAKRMVVAATIDWTVAKGIKRVVRRGRPFDFVSHTRIRGKRATGLGYLSGHSAIAASLMAGMAALTGRKAPWATLAVTVGLARIYVGAHLPLDVVGGLGLGLAVDDAVRRYLP